VTLATVPDAVWDGLAAIGVDVVWLMGVWRRSAAGRAIALADPARMDDFRDALPDAIEADVVGSAYCIADYVVDERLGGSGGLAAARAALARRGIRLLLDFVPNHVAPDHPWTTERPEVFVAGTEADIARDPSAFLRAGDRVLACGRDPYFPAWADVVQLDAFSTAHRELAARTLVGILDQCDGVRCDMAMLLLNDVFGQTWAGRVGPPPATEYWTDVIARVRAAHPDALLIAEAYWDLEARLQDLGFDACYDKRLYDRLVLGDGEGVRLHLGADLAYQRRLVRFVENHDEPRAATTFPGVLGRAAAVAALTLPGYRLLHDGQLEGRRVRLPVFLARAPAEPPDPSLATWYTRLLDVLARPALRRGRWALCGRSGWPGNERYTQLLAWCWTGEDDEDADGPERWLIVVNVGRVAAAGHVTVPAAWEDLRGRGLRLVDPVHDTAYDRTGEMLTDGLYVELPPGGSHLFSVRPAAGLAREEPA
jgi:hypothetical protein